MVFLGVKYLKFIIGISIFVIAETERERNAFEMTVITVEKPSVATLAETREVVLGWIILLCCSITDCTLIVV